jgi:hypothetical protein
MDDNVGLSVMMYWWHEEIVKYSETHYRKK